MVNTTELKIEMMRAGKSQRVLSKETNISINALNRKINGKVPFDCDEVNAVCCSLSIVDPVRKCQIFLA